jgi:hypothetical protein
MERGSFRTFGIRLDDEDVRVSGGWGKVSDIRAGSSSRNGAQPASPFGGASLAFDTIGHGDREPRIHPRVVFVLHKPAGDAWRGIGQGRKPRLVKPSSEGPKGL